MAKIEVAGNPRGATSRVFFSNCNWQLRGSRDDERIFSQECVVKIAEELNISPITAKLLAQRGYLTPEAVQAYFESPLSGLEDPMKLTDMPKAVGMLSQAIDEGVGIVVYGDYDVDGTTSCAVLWHILKSLGANQVVWEVPQRLNEGYGLHLAPLEKAWREGYRVLLTVDCGITNLEEVNRAKALGWRVIVTDHHQPGSELPPADAVINPKRVGETVRFTELAGVGVAFKLGHALARHRLGECCGDELAFAHLDLVALGTIADIVPLNGENRIMVRHGLSVLGKVMRPGIKALLEIAGIDPAKGIGVGQVGFGLAPRINAAGRLGDAGLAVELFTTPDFSRARSIASFLNEENLRRQQIEKEIIETCCYRVDEEWPQVPPKCLFLVNQGWHPGVIGIVASRLVEKYHRPSYVIAVDEDGTAKGSARGINGFNIHESLVACAEALDKFGGHQQAGGFSLRSDKIELFKGLLTSYVDNALTEEMLQRRLTVDAVVEAGEVNLQLVDEMGRMAPFGVGNPSPLLVIRDAEVEEIRMIGSECNHLKLQIKGRDGQRLNAIGFRMAGLIEARAGDAIDLCFSPEKNVFRGETSIRCALRDVRKSSLTTPLSDWESRISHELQNEKRVHVTGTGNLFFRFQWLSWLPRESRRVFVINPFPSRGNRLMQNLKDYAPDHEAVLIPSGRAFSVNSGAIGNNRTVIVGSMEALEYSLENNGTIDNSLLRGIDTIVSAYPISLTDLERSVLSFLRLEDVTLLYLDASNLIDRETDNPQMQYAKVFPGMVQDFRISEEKNLINLPSGHPVFWDRNSLGQLWHLLCKYRNIDIDVRWKDVRSQIMNALNITELEDLSNGLAIFTEIGLLSSSNSAEEAPVILWDKATKRDLSESIMFRELQSERLRWTAMLRIIEAI